MPVVKVLLISLVLIGLAVLALVVLGWTVQHLPGGLVGVGSRACTCQAF